MSPSVARVDDLSLGGSPQRRQTSIAVALLKLKESVSRWVSSKATELSLVASPPIERLGFSCNTQVTCLASIRVTDSRIVDTILVLFLNTISIASASSIMEVPYHEASHASTAPLHYPSTPTPLPLQQLPLIPKPSF
ncbi:hypothetical protein F2Q69_00054715 [Brassica cretica]|uniref:Uncharacterized protein n=1 Tax=Brassica cretica TaxID=69181 RepID=A0A8S9N1B3_BRACR|nr:hypothetical protein F2Q69_00054715 [Brassica cretica]